MHYANKIITITFYIRGNPMSEEKKTKKETKKETTDYTKLATRYCDEKLTRHSDLTYGACFYRGSTYIYDGKKYAMLNDLDFNHRIRDYFREEEIPQSNHLIGNVAPIVQNLIRKDTLDYPAMPFYTGKEQFPNPKNIIAYENGLLDLASMTLREHTPHWVSPNCLPYDFDPTATCPKWEAFLQEIFEGCEDQIEVLQEWFGYCSCWDTSLQKFLMLVGQPRAGKGILGEVLRQLVGEENTTGFSLFDFENKHCLVPLVGKMIAYCGEVELKGCTKRGQLLAKLKDITGEVPQIIDQKFNPNPYTAMITARLVIACNQVPAFYETTSALADRIILLRFNKSFAGREDYELKDKLCKELSGISNWAMVGLKRLRTQGRFSTSQSQREAVNEFKRENSPTLAFIQDCLIVERRLDPGNLTGVELTDKPISITKKRLEDTYRVWCMDRGEEGITTHIFLRNLKAVLPNLAPKDKTRGDDKVYLGIASRSI